MNLKEFLKKVKDLPTISAVAGEINAADKNDSLTAASLGAIISRDPSLTASTLKLANSAYYGMPREISNIERAVTILGFDTVKNMALTISVSKVFQKKEGQILDLEGLWLHSLGVGLAAKHLAGKSPLTAGDKAMPEQAYICGILHDIGKIAFVRNLPKEMIEILKQTRSGTIAQHEIEKSILGFNHQRAGQAMADAWNFPVTHQTVIRLHHTPDAATIGEDKKITGLVLSVYLGNKIAKAVGLGESTDPHQSQLTNDDLLKIGLDKQQIVEIIPQIKEEYARYLEVWR